MGEASTSSNSCSLTPSLSASDTGLSHFQKSYQQIIQFICRLRLRAEKLRHTPILFMIRFCRKNAQTPEIPPPGLAMGQMRYTSDNFRQRMRRLRSGVGQRSSCQWCPPSTYYFYIRCSSAPSIPSADSLPPASWLPANPFHCTGTLSD